MIIQLYNDIAMCGGAMWWRYVVALCGGGAALVPAVVAVGVAVGVAVAVAVCGGGVCGGALKILLSFNCKLLQSMPEFGII